MACGQALIFYAVYKLTRFILGFFEIVKDINETGDNVKKYLSSIIHAVKSEKHGDVIYFFEEETNKFIAQGRNDDELIAALKARLYGSPSERHLCSPRKCDYPHTQDYVQHIVRHDYVHR